MFSAFLWFIAKIILPVICKSANSSCTTDADSISTSDTNCPTIKSTTTSMSTTTSKATTTSYSNTSTKSTTTSPNPPPLPNINSSTAPRSDTNFPRHIVGNHPWPLDWDRLTMSSWHGLAFLHRNSNRTLDRSVGAVLLRNVETLLNLKLLRNLVTSFLWY